MVLLTSNTKTEKTDAAQSEYLTKIMQLAPHDTAGIKQNGKRHTVCMHSTPSCRAFCLFETGYGKFQNVAGARIERTQFLFNAPIDFKAQLTKETENFMRLCDKKQKLPAIRLNGFSDLLWESIMPEYFDKFSDCQFYDYTKYPFSKRPTNLLPANYNLTFSKSEKTTRQNMLTELIQGRNVACVFRDKLPDIYQMNISDPKLGRAFSNWLYYAPLVNFDIIDGDKSDLRFLDGTNKIIGLVAKGNAKKQENDGFVLNTDKLSYTPNRNQTSYYIDAK